MTPPFGNSWVFWSCVSWPSSFGNWWWRLSLGKFMHLLGNFTPWCNIFSPRWRGGVIQWMKLKLKWANDISIKLWNTRLQIANIITNFQNMWRFGPFHPIINKLWDVICDLKLPVGEKKPKLVSNVCYLWFVTHRWRCSYDVFFQ